MREAYDITNAPSPSNKLYRSLQNSGLSKDVHMGGPSCHRCCKQTVAMSLRCRDVILAMAEPDGASMKGPDEGLGDPDNQGFLPPTPMFTLLTFFLCSYFFSSFSVCAQTVNISNGVGILAYDGTCVQASNLINNSPVSLQPCNGNPGQRWDVSISGPHILDSDFAIFILSGTSECLDSIAASAYPELTGVYTCGGRSDGSGGQASHQAFFYNSFLNPNLQGPLVLIPHNGIVNEGNGPGQSCLTVSQGQITSSPCDPASPASNQQFYLGSRTSAPAASPSAITPNGQPDTVNSSGSSGTKSSSSSVSGTSGNSNSSNGSDRTPSGGVGSGSMTLVVTGAAAASRTGAPHGTAAGPSSGPSATGAASRDATRRHVNALVIAVPLAAVAFLLVLAFILARRCRRARQAKHDTQAARPFVVPSPAISVVTMDEKGYQDLKARMESANASPELAPIDNLTNDAASQDSPTRMPQSGDPVFQEVDINRIVSMVVARIDPAGPQDQSHIPTDAQESTDLLSADCTFPFDAPPPALDLSRTFNAQNGMNIDSILTALGARVDPSYRQQTALRDSRDLPPLYQISPGYDQEA